MFIKIAFQNEAGRDVVGCSVVVPSALAGKISKEIMDAVKAADGKLAIAAEILDFQPIRMVSSDIAKAYRDAEINALNEAQAVVGKYMPAFCWYSAFVYEGKCKLVMEEQDVFGI